MSFRKSAACFIAAAGIATGTFAQVTPAAGFTPPDDTPKFTVGATIFGDYTYADSPTSKDTDLNTIHPSSFNISRAYINITGNLNHIFAFRVTPDVSRETSTTPSLSGSQVFRLKYAYGQVNLDDWMTKGSWARVGVQQTPYTDYTEGIYRYRFQGTIFGSAPRGCHRPMPACRATTTSPATTATCTPASTTVRATPRPRRTTRRRSWCAERSVRSPSAARC